MHETSSKSPLVICFSGNSRDSAEIIEEQTAHLVGHSGPTIEAIDRLKADAIETKRALLVGDIHIKAIARILDDLWAAEKRTSTGSPTSTSIACAPLRFSMYLRARSRAPVAAGS